MKMYKKKCPYCGKKFESTRWDKRFCKFICNTKYKNIQVIKKPDKLSENDKKIWYKFKKNKQLRRYK
jgi:hypothetical protein